MRIITRKIIAVLLLLIFVEKAGLRLFIHDHLHANKTTNISKSHKPNQQLSKLPCDCLDDFFIPLQSIDEVTIPNPIINYILSSILMKDEEMFTLQLLSFQQRGPPAVT